MYRTTWQFLERTEIMTLFFTRTALHQTFLPSPTSRYKERSEIEALFFSINASLKALNQPIFIPKDGQLVHDIEREWNKLEKAEHRREVALRDELLRQERLEQLAYKFDKKVNLKERVSTKGLFGCRCKGVAKRS